MNRPFIYRDVNLPNLQLHIRYLAENLNDPKMFEIRIEDIDTEFSLIRNTYKTKPPTISLLIRTSDIGRDKILDLHNWLVTESYTLRIRKSPKKKYIS